MRAEYPRYADMKFTDRQLYLLTEGIEMLRLYQRGFTDREGREKLESVTRLAERLQRRVRLRSETVKQRR